MDDAENSCKLNSDFKANDVVLSPYNTDISLYSEDEVDKIIEKCEDEKSLKLIEKVIK